MINLKKPTYFVLSNLNNLKMAQNVISRIDQIRNSAEITEKRILEMRNKLDEVKRVKVEEKIKQLTQDNSNLESKVNKAISDLRKLETLHGKEQFLLREGEKGCSDKPVPNSHKVHDKTTIKKVKKEEPKGDKGKEKANETSYSIDVRKLDFRIGQIVDISKHPDADTLYVEKIDCGEDYPRTVVSGLVKHVPIEEMRDRIVMVLCNLKPVKMRGVTSEAMVMCASSPDKVEVLIPPNGAVPGDLVTCVGYPREPETQLNPKKKIFETCAPDLKTNEDKVACYKDSPLVVSNKGPVTAATLTGVSVK